MQRIREGVKSWLLIYPLHPWANAMLNFR